MLFNPKKRKILFLLNGELILLIFKVNIAKYAVIPAILLFCSFLELAELGLFLNFPVPLTDSVSNLIWSLAAWRAAVA